MLLLVASETTGYHSGDLNTWQFYHSDEDKPKHQSVGKVVGDKREKECLEERECQNNVRCIGMNKLVKLWSLKKSTQICQPEVGNASEVPDRYCWRWVEGREFSWRTFESSYQWVSPTHREGLISSWFWEKVFSNTPGKIMFGIESIFWTEILRMYS